MAKGTILHQHGSYIATPLVEGGLDDRANRATLGVCLEL